MTASHPLALQVQNLKKTYANGTEALQGIDLEVEQGDFYALLGPNGAGKSTAIGIITSLVTYSEGSVSIFGHDIQKEYSAARSCLGLVPQEFNFNQFEPAAEIVICQAGFYGVRRKEAIRRTQQLLEQLELWDKRSVMARELSGGMKRRLMIARAMVHHPKLLILDEPTAGVDLQIRHNLWRYLRQINEQGTTIILTTHYLEEAEQMCRNVGIISHGRIRANTSIRELLDQLDSEHFVLYLKSPVSTCPAIDGYSLLCTDDRTLEVTVSKQTDLNHLFAELNTRGIEVLSMKSKTNRLERLFLQIVGHKFE